MKITIERYTRISLDNKFQLQEKVLFFFGQISPKKGNFQSKTAKINSTIEFCIFESV